MTARHGDHTRSDDAPAIPRRVRRPNPAITGFLWVVGGVAFVGGGASDIAGYPFDGEAPSIAFLVGIVFLVFAWRRSAKAHRLENQDL
ncbi:hypothetical protein Asp14428_67200 [Actinoplanes sp. NBRC 14428]|uniref:Uncharacterized protein n=1 Tax=Pseudosporangium ferrugineum TaxID=439699 RepID=A0A2T0RNQ0_9ACTN|nr:hypothetical protein [Pseudosporangium ferrugineum]PRY22750.1 hypothetical protein CLV70_1169 [Pseudosporangium ferrugineum]BCJ55245.1 hypothetical protein Asp14428_67200 [Actinoplanes sp. NBRC 14428]